MNRTTTYLGLTLIAILAAGCSHMDMGGTSKMEETQSLYDRLGGEAAINAVVDDFVNRAAQDPKVNFTRKGTAREWDANKTNVDHLKKMLVQFIASASGGPQKYLGMNMKDSHKGMMISNAEFDALAADLTASLTKFNIHAKEQAELMARVESTRSNIVERP